MYYGHVYLPAFSLCPELRHKPPSEINQIKSNKNPIWGEWAIVPNSSMRWKAKSSQENTRTTLPARVEFLSFCHEPITRNSSGLAHQLSVPVSLRSKLHKEL